MTTSESPQVSSQAKALEQHFETLVSEVKTTHRKFEEMLQRHANSSSSRSCDKENSRFSPVPKCVRPVPLLNLQHIDPKPQSQKPPKSMIKAAMIYYKPVTTPKPFKLRTNDRAEIRKAVGGSPGRVTPCPGDVGRPRSAGCSPAAQQIVHTMNKFSFQFGRRMTPSR